MIQTDLLSILDLSSADVSELIRSAIALKKDRNGSKPLAGKVIAMIFEKPSLRTRVSFETGIFQLGGHAIYLEAKNIGPGARESVADIARNLERMVDGIVARTFAHKTITDLAKYAHIPVVNALTDLEHPCQGLACMMALTEKWGALKGKKMVYIGDGNNVAHSMALICPLVGMDFTICCPEGYEMDAKVMALAEAEAHKQGTHVAMVRNPQEAVKDASVVYTDTWTSMGQEEEHAARIKVFSPFQVNAALMTRAPQNCLVAHCLPAHRGEEITDEILDGPQSICFDEAENRLHAQKAVLAALI